MSGSGRGMNESLRSIRMLACCLLTLNTLCRAPFTTALAASADARTGPKVRFRGITRGDPERAENPLAEELRYLSGESVWSWSNIFEIGSPRKLVASDRAARSTGQRVHSHGFLWSPFHFSTRCPPGSMALKEMAGDQVAGRHLRLLTLAEKQLPPRRCSSSPSPPATFGSAAGLL